MKFQDAITNKLILLFVLEKMEMPLTEKNIIDICTSRNEWLNYMECVDILSQLLEVHFIYNIPSQNSQDDDDKYNITAEGQNCLAHFYQKIDPKLRENITEYIKANRMQFKKSQEYVADYSKNNDGTYLLVLKIRSDNINYPLFEIKITAPSRQMAIETCKKWRENAHIVYEQVYESLININEEGL